MVVAALTASLIVSASPPQTADATVVSSLWSCEATVNGNETRGRLYQVAFAGGVQSLYSYVEVSPGVWDLTLEATYAVPSGKALNALSLTPSGEMFAVLQVDGSTQNRESELVRVLPPSQQGGQGLYQSLGSYGAVTRADRAVNAGAYVEIGGVGHLLMSNNGKNINSGLYNLSTGSWSPFQVNGAGPVLSLIHI